MIAYLLSEVSSTAILSALLAAVSAMAGGFALLCKVALKWFLGPNLDGDGGAWGKLITAVEGTSHRLETIESKVAAIEARQKMIVENILVKPDALKKEDK